jgi:hypothetical protein
MPVATGIGVPCVSITEPGKQAVTISTFLGDANQLETVFCYLRFWANA